MATYWLELHCEGHGTVSGCHSNRNEHPGVLVSQPSTGAREVRTIARTWGWVLTRDGWWCPNCQKIGVDT